MAVRLAHFSDIHVTHNPFGEGVSELLGKPGIGALNYYVGGRRRSFERVEARILRLLEDVDAQGVDHALCTGDITAMSFESEFAHCAELFGDRLAAADRWTVIPGNHDRYTRRAIREKRFEKYFSPVADAGEGYPFKKALAPGVTGVFLDVARATSLVDSSGLCGVEQLEKARALLESAAADFTVLGLHYGLLRPGGRPDRRVHGIRDYQKILTMLAEVPVNLVLHGHMHTGYRVESGGLPIVCAGSATDLHRKCGYFVYDIDVERKTFEAARRTWNRQSERYEPAD